MKIRIKATGKVVAIPEKRWSTIKRTGRAGLYEIVEDKKVLDVKPVKESKPTKQKLEIENILKEPDGEI